MGAPAGQQPVFGDDRLNFRQFPDLAPFHGRSLPGLRVLQSTAAVRTGLRPVLHDFIDLLGRRQLPVVSLVPFLTTRLASALFFSVSGSLRRVLRGRQRGVTGMAIEPGLQLADLLLQLGNSIQSLAQGILQKQDISLHLWRELCPSLWTNRPCFHKTLNTLFFKKNRAFLHFFLKNLPHHKRGTERLPQNQRMGKIPRPVH